MQHQDLRAVSPNCTGLLRWDVQKACAVVADSPEILVLHETRLIWDLRQAGQEGAQSSRTPARRMLSA